MRDNTLSNASVRRPAGKGGRYILSLRRQKIKPPKATGGNSLGYLIAPQGPGKKFASKLAGGQQSSKRKLDPRTLNRNMKNMYSFYSKDGKSFTPLYGRKKEGQEKKSPLNSYRFAKTAAGAGGTVAGMAASMGNERGFQSSNPSVTPSAISQISSPSVTSPDISVPPSGGKKYHSDVAMARESIMLGDEDSLKYAFEYGDQYALEDSFWSGDFVEDMEEYLATEDFDELEENYWEGDYQEFREEALEGMEGEDDDLALPPEEEQE